MIHKFWLQLKLKRRPVRNHALIRSRQSCLLLAFCALAGFAGADQRSTGIESLRAYMPALTAEQYAKIDRPLRKLLARGEIPEIIVNYSAPALPNLPARLSPAQRKTAIANLRQIRAAALGNQKQALLQTLRARRPGIRETGSLSHLPLVNIEVADWQDLSELLKDGSVVSASANQHFFPAIGQSKPIINHAYSVSNSSKGAGTVVAILDTGVNYTQSNFGSCTSPGVPASCKVVHAQDFAPEDFQLDASGHGTRVSGIVTAVADAADLVVLDVFNGSNASTVDIQNAVNWIIANTGTYNFVSVNLSLSDGQEYSGNCDGGPGQPSTNPFKVMFDNLVAFDILPVAASGNDGYNNGISSPACVSSGFSVGATHDQQYAACSFACCSGLTHDMDDMACFSNTGAVLDIVAPGSRIFVPGGGTDGTSNAAPHVAAAVAILKAEFPADSISSVKSKLLDSSVMITDPDNGLSFPRLDLITVLGEANSDGDAVPDSTDPAPSDPCNPSTFIATCDADTDGDGKFDRNETDVIDSDGDGIEDYQESATADSDGDGTFDEQDPANADPCIPSNTVAACDSDGDGVPDGSDPAPADPCDPSTFVAVCDFDTDGDGKWDRDEGEFTDSDSDGVPDYQESSLLDSDSDGTVDEQDPADADPCVPSTFVGNCDFDTDGDGKWDREETDSIDTDNDGIKDYQDSATADADGDGVFDEQDPANTDPCDPSNTVAACDSDGDGVPDGNDPAPADPCDPSTFVAACNFDTDNDGKWDRDEGEFSDTDGDSIPDYLESSANDADSDGVNDEQDVANNDPCIPDIQASSCDVPTESVPINLVALLAMALSLLIAGAITGLRRK